MLNGAAWEEETTKTLENFIAAVGGKRFKPKRMGTRSVNHFEQLDRTGTLLNAEQATLYRALAARINYVSMDRADVAFAAKELCRDCSAPTNESVEALKKVVRYLKDHPRLVYTYAYENSDNILSCYVDTDFAGCVRSRRSTSGGVLMLGSHQLRHYSSTQQTLALSSGEAELIGIVKGATVAMGLRSCALDLGIELKIHIYSDASAAIGICRRRGLGKIRHLSVSELWVQEKLRCHDFELFKVLGVENPADALTKFVDKRTLESHLPRMSVRCLDGRPELAPRLQHDGQRDDGQQT